MDAGLGLFGLGLFLLSIAMLYARSAFGLAWVVLGLALVSMGLAFAETPRRREVALGLGVVLGVASVVSAVAGVAWWWWLATLLFGLAYAVLWAEFRFPFFQHVEQQAPRRPVTPRRERRA